MPHQPAVETALTAIAIAVSVQTILLAGLCVSAFIAWRRVQTALSATSADLHVRMDEMAEHLRSTTGRVQAAASSIERIAEGADAVAGGARRIAGGVGGAISTVMRAGVLPPTLFAMAGRLLLSRWKRRHPVTVSMNPKRR